MCGLALFLFVMFLFEAVAVVLMSRLMARGRKREKDWKIMVDDLLTAHGTLHAIAMRNSESPLERERTG